MKRNALTVLAYVAATFFVQAISHFGINAAHYAELTYARHDPILPMGVLAMLIQGGVAAYLYPRLSGAGSTPGHALGFAWLLGAFLVSYVALGEAGKYAVPAVGSWIAVEATAGLAQYTLFGLLLWLVHRGTAVASERIAATVS
jgi:hypothetical protein